MAKKSNNRVNGWQLFAIAVVILLGTTAVIQRSAIKAAPPLQFPRTCALNKEDKNLFIVQRKDWDELKDWTRDDKTKNFEDALAKFTEFAASELERVFGFPPLHDSTIDLTYELAPPSKDDLFLANTFYFSPRPNYFWISVKADNMRKFLPSLCHEITHALTGAACANQGEVCRAMDEAAGTFSEILCAGILGNYMAQDNIPEKYKSPLVDPDNVEMDAAGALIKDHLESFLKEGVGKLGRPSDIFSDMTAGPVRDIAAFYDRAFGVAMYLILNYDDGFTKWGEFIQRTSKLDGGFTKENILTALKEAYGLSENEFNRQFLEYFKEQKQKYDRDSDEYVQKMKKIFLELAEETRLRREINGLDKLIAEIEEAERSKNPPGPKDLKRKTEELRDKMLKRIQEITRNRI